VDWELFQRPRQRNTVSIFSIPLDHRSDRILAVPSAQLADGGNLFHQNRTVSWQMSIPLEQQILDIPEGDELK
jgi:hypothetical protein